MAEERTRPRLSSIMMLYLQDLKATGLYGNSIDGVARTLIEAGIREAIAQGHIAVRQDKASKKSKE